MDQDCASKKKTPECKILREQLVQCIGVTAGGRAEDAAPDGKEDTCEETLTEPT